jgi:hypothetical protein
MSKFVFPHILSASIIPLGSQLRDCQKSQVLCDIFHNLYDNHQKLSLHLLVVLRPRTTLELQPGAKKRIELRAKLHPIIN